MPISPTLPADGESNWDVSLNAALTEIIDEVNAQETDIAAALTTAAAPELIRDTMGSALVAGTNVTITPNDGADTITIAASGGGGGATDLDGLSDVSTSGQASGQFLGTNGSAWSPTSLPTSSTTVSGVVELATSAETTTGTDTVRATTPAGVKAVADTLAPLSHNHAASAITSGTVATARLGSGTADSTTFLRGDQTWAVPAGSGYTRTTVVYTTASLATDASETGTVTMAIGYRLLKIETSRAARVRVYTTGAARTADASRAIGTDPTGDHGLVAEVVTTGAILSYMLSPTVDGVSLESTPSTSISIAITNKGSTGTVAATFTWIRTE